VKLPLAILDAFGVKPTEGPRTSRGFAGRAAMLEMWQRMDADQQDQLLLAAEGILARRDEPVVVPVARAGEK
jgi:hypothetical protein